MRGESVLRFQVAGMTKHLLDGAHFPRAIFWIGVSEEAIGCELHAIADATTEDLRDRHAPGLTENIETRKLQRREDLGSIVVERRSGIGDDIPHLFETRGITSDKIGFHRAKSG